jgi:hypothetical protein
MATPTSKSRNIKAAATPATETAAEAAAADKDQAAAGAPAPGALATQGTQALGVGDFDYGDDVGAGFENQTQLDRKLPMIVVVQSNSPMVKDRKAHPGQLYNTVTGEAYDSIEFVPCITDRAYIEYVDRDFGGGYRGRHPLGSSVIADAQKRTGQTFGKLRVPQPDVPDGKGGTKKSPDHELVETAEVVAVLTQAYREGNPLYAGDQAEMPILIGFTSTKLSPYRDWSGSINMFQQVITTQGPNGQPVQRKRQVPMFAHRVRLRTVEDNRKGQDFYNVVLEPVNGDIPKSLIGKSDARYAAAKEMHDQYLKGIVRGDYEAAAKADAGDAASGDAKINPETGVPF